MMIDVLRILTFLSSQNIEVNNKTIFESLPGAHPVRYVAVFVYISCVFVFSLGSCKDFQSI